MPSFVAIDSASSARFPDTVVEGVGTLPPVIYGGAMYICLVTGDDLGPTPLACQIYKSTDLGNTWAIVDSGAGRSGTNSFFPIHDTVRNKIVVFSSDANGGIGTINVQEFDLATELWGSAAATGPSGAMSKAYVFTDGTSKCYVCYQSATSRMFGALWSPGGGWASTDTDLSANCPAVGAGTGCRASVGIVDSSSVLHLFFLFSSSLFGTTRWAYQLVGTGLSLGTFKDLQSLVGDLQDSVSFYSTPSIQGSKLLFYPEVNSLAGSGFGFPAILVGTPLSAPTWTEDNTTSIDPAFPGDTGLSPLHAPFSDVIAGVATVVYCSDGTGLSATQRFKICRSSDLSTWTSDVLFGPFVPRFLCPWYGLDSGGNYTVFAAWNDTGVQPVNIAIVFPSAGSFGNSFRCCRIYSDPDS